MTIGHETNSADAHPRYSVTIYLPRNAAGLDGRVRAAREMAAVAHRQPGFAGAERRRDEDTEAMVLYWRDLEAIDNWRAHIYESALRRYGAEAWQAFQAIEVREIGAHQTAPAWPVALRRAADQMTERMLGMFTVHHGA